MIQIKTRGLQKRDTKNTFKGTVNMFTKFWIGYHKMKSSGIGVPQNGFKLNANDLILSKVSVLKF